MEIKLYQCKEPGCEMKQRILSKGLCTFHRMKQKGSAVKKYKFKINRNFKKRNRADILKQYFEYHLEQIKKHPYCENCGCLLKCNINNIAHILPKRNCYNPEVMDNINNYLYLCASVNGEIGCHDRYDRIQGSSQVYLMPCWKKAVNRYLTFKNELKYNKFVSIFEEWIKENENQ